MEEIDVLLRKLIAQRKIKNSWYNLTNDGIKFENIHFRGNGHISAKERFYRYLKNVDRG